MSNTQERQMAKLRWKAAVCCLGACLALGQLWGCTAAPGGGVSTSQSVSAPMTSTTQRKLPQTVVPTETIHASGVYYNVTFSMDALIEISPVIISGRVVDWEYYIANPERDEAVPPQVNTLVTIEVVGVLAGSLGTGDTVKVGQMGGILDKTLWSFDEIPYLPDYLGDDLVLFLQPFDSPVAGVPFRLSNSFEGTWLNEGGSLSLLWGAAYDDKENTLWSDPADRTVFGAPEFSTTMTVEELKQAIAEHK